MNGLMNKALYFDAAMHVAVEHQDGLAFSIREWISETGDAPWDDLPATVVGVFNKDKSDVTLLSAPAPCWRTDAEKAEWISDIKAGCKELNALFCIVMTGACIARDEAADLLLKSEGRMRVSDLPEHMRQDVILLHMSCARGDRILMFENEGGAEVHDTGVCQDANQLDGDMLGFIEPAPKDLSPTNDA
tara:strand:- start:741 stop:1307 length:567 start_codon:yes stop_codon:yes gene_type:complete